MSPYNRRSPYGNNSWGQNNNNRPPAPAPAPAPATRGWGHINTPTTNQWGQSSNQNTPANNSWSGWGQKPAAKPKEDHVNEVPCDGGSVDLSSVGNANTNTIERANIVTQHAATSESQSSSKPKDDSNNETSSIFFY